MKVYVVDDSPAMRMMVIRTIKSVFRGHDFEQGTDGSEALEYLRKNEPDVVLADWNMPGMTGIEVLEQLNEEGYAPRVFGFVTTESSEPMRARASAAGARFLIAKPFTEDAVEEALKPFLK